MKHSMAIDGLWPSAPSGASFVRVFPPMPSAPTGASLRVAPPPTLACWWMAPFAADEGGGRRLDAGESGLLPDRDRSPGSRLKRGEPAATAPDAVHHRMLAMDNK
ncbi:hypothetical protein ABZP36_001855, partial [Zizania latifolia]